MSQAKLISETFVRPEIEVDEFKRVHHLNPIDVSRLLMDNSQPGYLYAKPPSNFTPSSYLELLRSSLSQTLVHFYPLAGRLKIKAIANSDVQTGSKPILTFQSLIAFVWKCITRARNLNPGDLTTCGLPLNLRPRFNPPLTNEYFGNYAIKAKTTVKVGDLLVNSIGWAATLLNKAVEAQDDKSARDIIKRAMEIGPVLVPPTRTCRSNDVIVASSPRFDVEASKFGLDRLVGYRGGYTNKGEGKVYAYSGSLGNGSMDLEIRLVPQTMAALLLDREFMSFVSPNNAYYDLVSKI
ncbi:uncharacterized protein LOC141641837 [Silene latifolia]|uniref:uncharacterized protein LOC141641837 n=1 Tax=Silene latifolia TaxID=37657 RepID=UPI003D7819EF